MGWIILWAVLGLLLLLIAAILVNTLRVGTKSVSPQEAPLLPEERVAHYAETLSRMLAQETVTVAPGGDLSKIYAFHRLLEELYPNIHRQLERVELDGTLLFHWRGSGRSDRLPLLLMSHMDVVPAEGAWSHPPFAGEVEEGIIWGRGAVDTKGSLCGFMNAVEELLAEGYVPPQDVYLASSCNEEINGPGAPATVDYLAAQGVKLGLVLDEGGAVADSPLPGLDCKFAMIGLMEKGNAQVKFVAKSKGGHASTPPRGTPLARLAGMVNYIEKKNPFSVQFTPPVEGMFREMAPYMSMPLRLVLANLWLFKPLLKSLLPKFSAQAGAMLQTTCAFTMAAGSEAANVIPQEASITANLRFMSHERKEATMQKLRAIGERFDVEVQLVSGWDCSGVSSADSYGYQAVKACVQKTFPEAGVAPYIMLQGSDSRHYERICDCVLRFAPLSIDKQQLGSIHGVDENLGVEALAKAVLFYKELVQGYFSAAPAKSEHRQG